MRALSAKALAVKSNGLSSLLGPVRLQTSQTWPPGSPGILLSLPVTGSSRMSESHLYPKLLPPRDRAALPLDVLPCTIQPFGFNPFSSGSPAVAAGFPFVSSASPSSHALGWWSRWTPPDVPASSYASPHTYLKASSPPKRSDSLSVFIS